MKIKKTLIIALFLLCILMIGAVSASDNITDDKVSLEPKQDIQVTNNELTKHDISTTDKTKSKQETTSTHEISTSNITTESNKSITKTEIKETNNGKTKLKNSKDKEEILSEMDEELFFISKWGYELNIRPGYVTNENGTLNIFIDNDLKRTYDVVNGKPKNIDENEHLIVNLLEIINKNRGYNLTVEFNSNSKKYTLYNEEIGNTIDSLYFSEELITTLDSGLINMIYDDDRLNGDLRIYVNNETEPRRTYAVKNGKIDHNEYETYITLSDIGISTEDKYHIKLIFTPKGINNEILIDEKDFNYTYNPIYMVNINYISTSEDSFELDIHDSGTLKIFIDGEEKINKEIPKYSGFSEYTDNHYYIRDMNIAPGYHKVKITFEHDDKNLIVYDSNIIYIEINSPYYEINTTENILITVKLPTNITGEVNAYSLINYDYGYKEDKLLRTSNILNGVAEIELSGEQIALSRKIKVYDEYENLEYANEIELEIITNEGTVYHLDIFKVIEKQNLPSNSSSEQKHDQNQNIQQTNPPASMGTQQQTGTNTQQLTQSTTSTSQKVTLTPLKAPTTISKKAKQLTISTTLKIGNKKAKKGQKIKYQIKYRKTTITKYIKVKK